MTRLALSLGIDRESAKWLPFRHGSRVTDIFALCEDQPVLAKRIVSESPFILADLLFCARTEMVVHLEDLLRRRLPLLILARLTPEDVRRIADLVAPVLAWSQGRIESECRLLSYAIKNSSVNNVSYAEDLGNGAYTK